MITEHNFGTGAHVSPSDERDYQWSLLGASAIPFSWDLGYETSVSSLKNQGQSSSCGGQATSYYGEVLEAVSSKTPEERSAKFIYSQVFQPGGGSFLRDNCDIAVKQGWARETVLPSYEENIPPTEVFMTRTSDITDAVRLDASQSKAMSYALVNNKDIDAVAQAIANNHGAIILIQGTNNGTWLSNTPAVTKPGDTTWNHFLYACGAVLKNGQKYIKVKNSWGNVGDNGYQYIHEDFFKNGYILEVRTIVFNDKPAQFQFKKDLRFGMRNADVLQLQTRLVKEGFGNYEPTGYFGIKTLASVVAYQKAHSISPAVGYVGQITRTALNG